MYTSSKIVRSTTSREGVVDASHASSIDTHGNKRRAGLTILSAYPEHKTIANILTVQMGVSKVDDGLQLLQLSGEAHRYYMYFEKHYQRIIISKKFLPPLKV
jgi:hypothetical protein